jgi:hypothetical protein
MSLCEAWCRITYEMLKDASVLKQPRKRNSRRVMRGAVAKAADKRQRRPKHAGYVIVRKRALGDKLIEQGG